MGVGGQVGDRRGGEGKGRATDGEAGWMYGEGKEGEWGNEGREEWEKGGRGEGWKSNSEEGEMAILGGCGRFEREGMAWVVMAKEQGGNARWYPSPTQSRPQISQPETSARVAREAGGGVVSSVIYEDSTGTKNLDSVVLVLSSESSGKMMPYAVRESEMEGSRLCRRAETSSLDRGRV